MEDREMLMKEFREQISPNAILELISYHTQETIKECKAIELTEYDMNLVIQGIHATINVKAATNINAKQKAPLGMFVIWVTED
jgi:hypothetical protein